MSIGQTLASAREKAGLTVEQVAAATRIRRTLVMDIERDDFASSGGDFYARGHVRTIAQKVGIDPAPLLAEFDAARPEAAPPRATDVFESETAARAERRGPNWSAAMAVAVAVRPGLRRRPGRDQGLADAHRRPLRRPARHDDELGAGDDDPEPDADRRRQRGRAGAAHQGHRRRPGAGHQLGAGDDRERRGALPGPARGRDPHLHRPPAASSWSSATPARSPSPSTARPIGSPGRPGQVARVQFTPQDPAAG